MDKSFAGNDKGPIRRRNALVNSLVDSQSKDKPLNSIVRGTLLSLAPCNIWQYFSSQGKSGSTKRSLLDEMPNCYAALLCACAQITQRGEKEIISCLSTVLKSCKHRSISQKFRLDHPTLSGQMDEAEVIGRPIDMSPSPGTNLSFRSRDTASDSDTSILSD